MKALVILVLALAIFGGAGYYGYELFVRPQVEIKREKALPPTPAPPDPALPEFKKAAALKEAGNLIEARSALADFVEHHPESKLLDEARTLLGSVNVAIFLTPIPAPEKEVYIVKSGDVLNRVAGRTKTTAELILRANNLSGTMLRIGQKLYTSPGNFSLVISRKQSKVIVLNDGKFFQQYPILEWPAALPPLKRGQPAPPKVVGKVLEKIAWLNGGRVIFTDKGYGEALHWISISIPHCTLYAPTPADADPKTVPKPPSGIVISPEATAELGAMLARGNPVTLE